MLLLIEPTHYNMWKMFMLRAHKNFSAAEDRKGRLTSFAGWSLSKHVIVILHLPTHD